MGEDTDWHPISENNKKLAVENFIDMYCFKDRTIFLDEDIGEESAALIIKKIKVLEMINNKKDIVIYINSEGGDIYDGLAIYDTMRTCKCDIRTIALGKAMSAAAWLLLAGTPGKRYAHKNTRIMVHEGSTVYLGEEKLSDLDARNKETKLLNKIYIDILKEHTKIDKTYKEIEQWLSKDVYMNSEEAKKLGIIDDVI